MKKVLLTATVQSHICQFHKPLVQMLRDSGEFEIHVAARNNLGEKNGLKLDFADKVFEIPFERSPFDLKNITAYKKLKKLIDENGYDYIHCNTPVGGVVTRLAAKKARKSGAKVLYTAHGFHFYKGASIKNWLMYYPIERMLSRFTDTLITINEEDYLFAKSHFGCRVERIHGVGVDDKRYYPVDSEKVKELKQKFGFNEDSRLILCVGELLPNKNQKMAIEAMRTVVKTFSNAVLMIAGNGPNRENLEALVADFGLEKNVAFLGYCTNLEEYQRIAEISVSCSIREGLGINLIEAMLTGNPVVATHNRGHNELVIEGSNGHLVNMDDFSKLAEHIIQLLSSEKLRNTMGEFGRNFVEKYCFSKVEKELRGIYFGKNA